MYTSLTGLGRSSQQMVGWSGWVGRLGFGTVWVGRGGVPGRGLHMILEGVCKILLIFT